MMEEEEVDSQKLINKVKEYVQVRSELSILHTVDKGSQLFAGLLTDGLVLILSVLAGFFGSLALGFYLSECIGNTYAGFLIVAGIYLIAALILNAIKEKYLEKRIANAAIAKFFKVRNEEHNGNKDSK